MTLLPVARRQHLVRRLYALGPRPLDFFIRELERGRDLHDALEDYARLDPRVIAALDAASFLPPATVAGGRR